MAEPDRQGELDVPETTPASPRASEHWKVDHGLIRHHVNPMIRRLRRRANSARTVGLVMVGLLVGAIGIAGYWFVVIGDQESELRLKQEAEAEIRIRFVEVDYNELMDELFPGESISFSRDYLASLEQRRDELEANAEELGYVRIEAPTSPDGPRRYRFVRPADAQPSESTAGDPNGTLGDTLAQSAPELANRITLVVGLFIVLQLLISIFRYNMRLAAFYDARADALQLGGSVSESTFERLVQVLSPDAYDFGKPPKTPTDQAVEIAKMITQRSQRTGGG